MGHKYNFAMGICFVMGLILLDFQMFSMFSFSKYLVFSCSDLPASQEFPLVQASQISPCSLSIFILTKSAIFPSEFMRIAPDLSNSAVFSPEICGKFAVIPGCFRIFEDKSNASASCVILCLLREIIFE